MLAHPVFNESRIKVVLPDLHVIVVVDTETGGVLVQLPENIDPAVFVSSGALALVKTPQLFNLLAVLHLVSDLARDPILDVLLVEKDEVVERKHLLDVLQRVNQFCVIRVLQALRLLSP